MKYPCIPTPANPFIMRPATKKISILAVSLFFIFLLLSSCNKPYSADEGKKMLVAADRELTRSLGRFMETQAFAALMKLNDLDQVPLPMRYFQMKGVSKSQTYFNFSSHSGYYKEMKWGELELIRPSDSLIIDFIFQQQTGKRAVFIIENYQESTTAFGNQMPVSAKACILLDGRKIMEIVHEALLKHGIPVEIHAQIRMNHMRLKFDSKIKLGKNSGNLKLNTVLRDSEKELLNAEIRSKLGFGEHQTLYFGSKTIKINVFPLQFRLKSDYPFDGMSLASFIDDFNRLTRMDLTDQQGRQIGHLKLAFVPEKDRISFLINFPDGQTSNLEESMVSVRRILSFKLENTGLGIDR